MNKITRFRAYQLGEKGASFSLAADDYFTLIEARLNDYNFKNVLYEMRMAGVNRITLLHITSWDEDHCKPSELSYILKNLKPYRIEIPGYQPDTECGKESLRMISDYLCQYGVDGNRIDPNFINNLEFGVSAAYSTILYNPTCVREKHNDMSTVALFRIGRFNVLSLGDCENSEIAQSIMNDSIASKETDVMLMAHHGADNGFTTNDFIRKIAPRIAICASDYDNQYDHPREEIRQILYDNGVPLYTTKTGDVLVVCSTDNIVHVINYKGNGEEISSEYVFEPKIIVNQ